MGAGVSQKTMNRYYYRRLKNIQAELIAAGVPTIYRKFQLFPDTTHNPVGYAFNIRFDTLRASNGETAGLLNVMVEDATGTHNWRFPQAYTDGIARIKKLFRKFEQPTDQQISDGVIDALQNASGVNRRDDEK